MARRGGAQQLQVDIKTDEDLEKFIVKPGLLVLEVYSEWCGPCLGMLGTLRKVKLELGGDNLQLAICQSDTVTALKRFHKRSEPTWLFAANGRATNLYYGSDAPKLAALIVKELELVMSNANRPTYAIADLQPVEKEALRIKNEIIEKAERIEREKKHKKRMDYLNHCTDLILENLPDVGVTVFGPQVSRDMFKKLSEPADHLKMQCKDRKYMEVFATDFEVINYACKNPLPVDVIEQLNGKELLICYWKIDESAGPIPHVLATYAHELTKERIAPPDEEFNAPHPIPPIIVPLKVKYEVEVEEGEVWVEEISSEEEARIKAAEKEAAKRAKSITRMQEEKPAAKEHEVAEDDGEEEEMEEDEAGGEKGAAAPPAMPDMAFDMNLGFDDDNQVDEEEVEEEEEEAPPPKPITRTKRVKIPPIWVANNRRTHAALVYVFFRSQTAGFLPPDPPPEPPHIVMAFEASKHDDVMDLVETTKEDILQYGFFTSDNPEDAKLITNNIYKYDDLKNPKPDDRFVLKVNKVQSYTMLSLVQFEPTYCSSNVDNGKLDALKFFPEDYKTDEEIPENIVPKIKKVKQVAAPVEVAEAAPIEMEAPTEGAAPEGAAAAAPVPEGGEPALPADAAAATTEPSAAPPADGAEPSAEATAAVEATGAPKEEPAPAEPATATEAPAETAAPAAAAE